MSVAEPLHPDFQKILRQFQKRYGKKKGTSYFWAWVNRLGLNPDRPYGEGCEKFSWIKPHFNLIKQDKEAKWYRVEALFPLSSMNRNVYTEKELTAAARSLIDKPVNLNHQRHVFKGVTIQDAEYEDDVVEVLLRVLNNAGHGLGINIQKMIEEGAIIHVSIEASCRRGRSLTDKGVVCHGLVFTGLALLTKDVLPGVPLTRIMPVEKIVESVMEDKMLEEKEKIAKSKKRDVKKDRAKKFVELKFQISELKRKTRILEAERDAACKRLEEERKAAQAKLVEEQENMKSQLKAKDKKLNELQVEVYDLQKNTEVLAGKLQTAEQMHSKVVDELNSCQAKLLKAENELKRVEEEHISLVQQMEETRELLNKEQKSHFDESTENLRLTQQLTLRNNDILKLKNTIHELREKLKKAKRVGRILVKV